MGADLYRQLSLSGITHCLVEGDNLDLALLAPWQRGLQIAELNLTAMWANYRSAGYFRLIYTNTVCVRSEVLHSLVQALGGHPVVRAVLLTASDEVAEARLGQREIGRGLDWHVARNRQAAQELEDDAPEWVWRISTDRAGVDDIAHEIITGLGWSSTRSKLSTSRRNR